MTQNVTITISHDEAHVLFEFFHRFADSTEFRLRHNAEYLSFSRIAGQLNHALVDPFLPDYSALLNAARERITAGYEGTAPGVMNTIGDE